jgi:hypothetical protein
MNATGLYYLKPSLLSFLPRPQFSKLQIKFHPKNLHPRFNERFLPFLQMFILTSCARFTNTLNQDIECFGSKTFWQPDGRNLNL